MSGPGILARILGSGDVIKQGIDLIDGFHTSLPEEVEAKTKAKVDMLAAYAPFKLTQRVLAIMFASTYLICFVISLTSTLYALAVGETVLRNGEIVVPVVAAVAALMDAYMLPYIMLTVFGFYFGGGAFEGVVNAVRNPQPKKK